ncbi:MAG: MFS transporter, partial [Aurantibacter sp.]
DVAEKIGIVIGMVIFALVDQISTMRYAILFLFVFFLLGIILLMRVPKKPLLKKRL